MSRTAFSEGQIKSELKELKDAAEAPNSPVLMFTSALAQYAWIPAKSDMDTETISLFAEYGKSDAGCIVYNPAYIHQLYEDKDYVAFYAICATIGLAIRCGYYGVRNGIGIPHTKAVQIMLSHLGVFNKIRTSNGALNAALSALENAFANESLMDGVKKAYAVMNTTAYHDPSGAGTSAPGNFGTEDWNLETIRQYIAYLINAGATPPSVSGGSSGQTQPQGGSESGEGKNGQTPSEPNSPSQKSGSYSEKEPPGSKKDENGAGDTSGLTPEEKQSAREAGYTFADDGDKGEDDSGDESQNTGDGESSTNTGVSKPSENGGENGSPSEDNGKSGESGNTSGNGEHAPGDALGAKTSGSVNQQGKDGKESENGESSVKSSKPGTNKIDSNALNNVNELTDIANEVKEATTQKIQGLPGNLAKFANDPTNFSNAGNTGSAPIGNFAQSARDIAGNINIMSKKGGPSANAFASLDKIGESESSKMKVPSHAELEIANRIVSMIQNASSDQSERKPGHIRFQKTTFQTNKMQDQAEYSSNILIAIDASGSMWYPSILLKGAMNLLGSIATQLGGQNVYYVFWDDSCDIPRPFDASIADAISSGGTPSLKDSGSEVSTHVGGSGTDIRCLADRLSPYVYPPNDENDQREIKYNEDEINKNHLIFADDFDYVMVYSDFCFEGQAKLKNDAESLQMMFDQIPLDKIGAICCDSYGEQDTPDAFKENINTWISYPEWVKEIKEYEISKNPGGI